MSGIELLRSHGYEIDYHDETTALSNDALLERTREADALWCLLDDRIDRDFLEGCSKLKIVANYAVGYNNIDIEVARSRGIWVCNTPDVLTNATADLAFTLLLAIARRIIEGHRFVLDGKFQGWESTLLLGSEITGKRLGVMGAGRIGSAMAKRALGFDMEVSYMSRSEKPELDRLGCMRVDVDEIIQSSDFLSLHLPLTEDTYHILDQDRLLMMKHGAYLINTGRGQLINEAALVEVLQSGHLSGAGLDVYEFEPEVTPALYGMDNVVLLPHIGSATTTARNEMSRMCAQAIIAIGHDKFPDHPIFRI